MKYPIKSKHEADLKELTNNNTQKTDENSGWEELVVDNMLMSKAGAGLTVDVQRTSLKLSAEDTEETVQLALKPFERVHILVNGTVQADISYVQFLERIGKKLEERNVASRKSVRELLEGKNRNLLSGFTTLTTLLKLILFLNQHADSVEATSPPSERKNDRDHEIGPYF